MEDKQISRCVEIKDDSSFNIIDLEEVVYAYYTEGDKIKILFKNGEELECPFQYNASGMRAYKKFAKEMRAYKNYITNCNRLI